MTGFACKGEKSGWDGGMGRAMKMRRERNAWVVQVRGTRTHLAIRTFIVDVDIYKWTTD